MKRQWGSFSLWVGVVVAVTGVLLARPAFAVLPMPGNIVPTPEPATLTLFAIGGGALALARYRRSRRGK
jgi:hypothetical protein